MRPGARIYLVEPSSKHSKESHMSSYFAEIPAIPFEGPSSQNPLAYRYYQKDRMVLGKRMEDQLRFAVAYWHTFCGTGVDPFGPAGTG